MSLPKASVSRARIVICLSAALLLLPPSGCKAVGAAPPTTQPGIGATAWTPAFRGIDLSHVTLTAPRPMEIHAARIDLRAEGVRFVMSPPVADQPTPMRSLKTSSFLTRYPCQLAINASPYDPVVDDEGQPQKVVGLAVSEGKVYGTELPGLGALLITRDNRVHIGMPPFDLSLAHNAAGGFSMVLSQGKNVGDNHDLHPRTAAGVSRDGRYLYLLVIDGRQPLYSEGATTADLGTWLANLGAWDGLNFDGGGSSAMVIEGPDGKPLVLNRPIHKNIPGTERPSASHLGVIADRLPK